MKLILATFMAMPFVASAAAEAEFPRPSPEQAEWLDVGVGIFIHWAPNVYQGGEGDNLSTPRDKINPDKFDAAKIAQAVKSAGAGYVIFVAKHCGGYCAWQTDTTDYSLKTSPWKNGKGDMVGDLARLAARKACALASISVRVRISTRSATAGTRANAEKQKEYNEIYRQQLTEILTNYGPMFEMWFDGGNIVPVNDLIAKLARASSPFKAGG